MQSGVRHSPRSHQRSAVTPCAPCAPPAPKPRMCCSSCNGAGKPPPDLDHDRSGGIIGSFTLCEPIAAGGGGIVYRAEQHIGPYRREVAVKLIHPTLLQAGRGETLARFLAEIGTLVRLEHEGI